MQVLRTMTARPAMFQRMQPLTAWLMGCLSAILNKTQPDVLAKAGRRGCGNEVFLYCCQNYGLMNLRWSSTVW